MALKGILVDLDGVIYNDTQPIQGAAETIRWLQNRNIPFRFITNTTMKNRTTLRQKLQKMGIEVPESNIFSAVSATVAYLKQFSPNRSYLLLTEDAKQEFAGIEQSDRDVNFVVVGDLGQNMKIELLNRAFNCLMQGAKLIALQKNRFWLSDQGYQIDAGAFVALLEYAANTRATVIGKPSKDFFNLALKELNASADQVLMVGDDIESDIQGAAALKIKTCLVKTGKFLQKDLDRSPVKPDFLIESIAQLPEILEDLLV